ncbi:unnamed protein product [Protopolystoma xenopodis]|uniref:Uncharacterized protein n=1 Tax=Protopolystoma xenopodis TaxID=117903 RepID=A0A448XKP5_9PLAT|nr:unnamed protein product [Protopolystoma xenopodis]
MAILTDDAGETFGNVPRRLFDFGNDHADNGLRTRCVPLSHPTNMTTLRKQGQTTSIKRKETATTQKSTPSWSSYLRRKDGFRKISCLITAELIFISEVPIPLNC